MNVRSALAPSLVVVALLAAACGNTPTEPTSAPTTGNLVITLTQPCSLPGSVSAVAGSTQLGVLLVPGQNTFSLPAGTYYLSFVRGEHVFGAPGQVQVPAGGTVVVTDPPGACMSAIGEP